MMGLPPPWTPGENCAMFGVVICMYNLYVQKGLCANVYTQNIYHECENY